ncbi:uncharacterized protein LOC122499248 [Leptopilina heterotoma]|uniref:uncharacterized protein LOC122499248 n=1 Tax=Leptopilina heterotoma TaxID=63436 RepID=UPI001CA7E3E0|nr:uncharacterized protein LOC122499248 [Leptopilina heterotoma]XP_043463402.1 uncharacterized protein LOC122499248 [Leptopilina heterotoma]
MQIEKMNEQYSDDSDCFIIDDEKEPKVDSLLIKKGPNGNYSVERNKENKKCLPVKELIKPSNQTKFYTVPVFKNQMFREEVTKNCQKCIVENSRFPSNSSLQKISVPNLKISNKVVNQDPIVDSTNNDLEHCPTNLLESDIEDEGNIYTQKSMSLCDSGISRFNSGISSTNNHFNFQSSELKTAEISIDSGINSPTLNPITLSRSPDGKYCIKKDCFFGEKSSNLSEFELLTRNSSLEKRIKYSDMQLEEPVLEKIFSPIIEFSNSQATTVSIDYDITEEDEEDFYEGKKEEDLVDEDGSLRVINKSDSNVCVIGSN